MGINKMIVELNSYRYINGVRFYRAAGFATEGSARTQGGERIFRFPRKSDQDPKHERYDP